MKDSTVILNSPDCYIELIHRRSNPTNWIVLRSTKSFWFKKRVSSHWFIDSGQAMTFAREMKLQHERTLLSDRSKKKNSYA